MIKNKYKILFISLILIHFVLFLSGCATSGIENTATTIPEGKTRSTLSLLCGYNPENEKYIPTAGYGLFYGFTENLDGGIILSNLGLSGKVKYAIFQNRDTGPSFALQGFGKAFYYGSNDSKHAWYNEMYTNTILSYSIWRIAMYGSGGIGYLKLTGEKNYFENSSFPLNRNVRFYLFSAGIDLLVYKDNVSIFTGVNRYQFKDYENITQGFAGVKLMGLFK